MKLFVLNEDFDTETMSDFFFFLLDCKREGKKAVVLICSDGGSTEYLEAMVDVLNATKVHLITVGMGIVASSAAVFFCLGEERYLLPHAVFMIHDISRSFEHEKCVNRYEMEQMHKDDVETSERIVRLLGKNTKITPEVFEKKCGHGVDWILTPEEWDKYNIVTDTSEKWLKIIEKARED